jgi:hypothetical protein
MMVGVPEKDTARQPTVDVLRLEVAPVPEAGLGFQVRVYVDGVEMTSAGAGLGMDPYDLLVPTNRLVATVRPSTVPIARCECGDHGCGATDAVIRRDGDLVRWDWSIEVPMNRGVAFDAAQYDAEIARVLADRSWETPERAAGRLVLTGMDRDRLLVHGIVPSWVADNYRDRTLFRVALRLEADYQVFLDTPWRGRRPDELAGDVCATLALPPQQWRATWRAINPALTTTPPAIAGPSWRREQP